jgi:hypothetical protein
MPLKTVCLTIMEISGVMAGKDRIDRNVLVICHNPSNSTMDNRLYPETN